MNRMALVLLVAVAGSAISAKADVKPASLFQDNMVLQQGMKVPVWGTAAPGEEITVSFAGQSKKVTAGKDGNWSVNLEALKAAPGQKPGEMTIAGKNQIKIANVLVGEVWVCSGQSNMGLALSDTAGADKESAAAKYPQIRMFVVRAAATPTPQASCDGSWVVCSPETARSFSATGYYFARDLHRKLAVPVGMINASWSATAAEPWTALPFLEALPVYKDRLGEYKKRISEYLADKDKMDKEHAESLRQYNAHRDWFNKLCNDDMALKLWDESNWKAQDWKQIDLPFAKGKNPMADFAGITWYRKEVEIPQSWVGKKLRLMLPRLGDMAVIWIKGAEINNWWDHGQCWNETITRPVGPELVTSRKLTLIIRSHTLKVQAFADPAEEMAIEPWSKDDKPLSLKGSWNYRHTVTMDRKAMPPEGRSYDLPGYSQTEPGTLYNGMIYPLIPFAIRGAIWYQGESNTERASEYAGLLQALIRGWRQGWGQGDFPFIIVQLPNFQARQTRPIEKSDWAMLRDAQLKTLQLAKTGMACTIDIGDAENIHPSNKRDVGGRLALWALGTTYGQKMVYSGPLYKSMEVKGQKVLVKFAHTGGGLIAKGGPLTGFAVAGEDKTFHVAEAEIRGDSIVVWSDKVAKPLAVRYAWAGNPVCSLVNKEGLPASPFRSDNWSGDDCKAADEPVSSEAAK